MLPNNLGRLDCLLPDRPFVWRNEVYLGHWIGFLPAQERMAIARLDLDAGVVQYVHRFSYLSDEDRERTIPKAGTGTPLQHPSSNVLVRAIALECSMPGMLATRLLLNAGSRGEQRGAESGVLQVRRQR